MTASSAKPSTATLPVWNFAKFYKSPTDPAIGKDIDRLRQIESEFTRLEAKPEANLAKLLALQVEARSICDQLRMYASHNLSIDADSGEFKALQSRVTLAIASVQTSFVSFYAWLGKLEQAKFDELLKKHPASAEHLRKQRREAAALMDEPIERALAMAPSAVETFSGFADMMMATKPIRFTVGDREFNETLVTIEALLGDSDPAVASAAKAAFVEALRDDFAPMGAAVLNVVAQQTQSHCKNRGFGSAVEFALAGHRISHEGFKLLRKVTLDHGLKLMREVEALMAMLSRPPQSGAQTVTAKASAGEKRQSKTPGAAMNVDLVRTALNRFSRGVKLSPLNSPLGNRIASFASRALTGPEGITWEQSCQIVADAMQAFHPGGAKHFKLLLDNGWIDAQPRQGKTSGAYCDYACHRSGPVALVFLSYTEDAQGLGTAAHEVGHADHGLSSAEKGGALALEHPLWLAETASTFNEAVLADYIISQSPEAELPVLLMELSSAVGLWVVQMAFAEFEIRFHERYWEKGALDVEEFRSIWSDVNREYFGSTDANSDMWALIPHFRYVLYVPNYSFAMFVRDSMCIERDKDRTGFPARYREMLSGGSLPDLSGFNVRFEDPKWYDEVLEGGVYARLKRARALAQQTKGQGLYGQYFS